MMGGRKARVDIEGPRKVLLGVFPAPIVPEQNVGQSVVRLRLGRVERQGLLGGGFGAGERFLGLVAGAGQEHAGIGESGVGAGESGIEPRGFFKMLEASLEVGRVALVLEIAALAIGLVSFLVLRAET